MCGIVKQEVKINGNQCHSGSLKSVMATAVIIYSIFIAKYIKYIYKFNVDIDSLSAGYRHSLNIR